MYTTSFNKLNISRYMKNPLSLFEKDKKMEGDSDQ